MKLILDDIYITGGPNNQKTLTLPFRDGSNYSDRYVHVQLKPELTDQEVILALGKAIMEVGDLGSLVWEDGKGWVRPA